MLGEFNLSGSVDPIPETSASHSEKRIKMSVKLYVGNLPFSMTESELTDLFAQVGNVARVQLINDRVTGRPRGFGFVEMGTADEGQAAIAKFHGFEFQGRQLTVNEARPMEPREGGGGGGGGGGGYRGGGGGGGGERRGGGGGERRGGGGDRDRGDRDRGDRRRGGY